MKKTIGVVWILILLLVVETIMPTNYETAYGEVNRIQANNIDEDIDKNGEVDIFDMSIIANVYMIKVGEIGYSKSYDVNNDGVIDIYDLVRVAKKFGIVIETYKVYRIDSNWNDIYVGDFRTLDEAKSVAKDYDSIIKDKNNSIVWENIYTVYQTVETNQTNIMIGYYKKIEEAKSKASNYNNTYILNGVNEEIWTNSFRVKQRQIDGQTINVSGRYDTIASAKQRAKSFDYSYVYDGIGKEVWANGYPGKINKSIQESYGPSASHAKGSETLAIGKEVKILNKDGSYYEIEYKTGIGTKKRSYVPVGNVTVAPNCSVSLASNTNTVIYSKSAQDVIGGPGNTSTYTKIGSVSKDEKVNQIRKEESYSLIEYDTSSGRKRGYVLTTNLNYTKPEGAKPQVGKVVKNNCVVEAGPGKNYKDIETIAMNTQVKILEQEIKPGKEEPWVYIEYVKDGKKKRGYVYKSYVSYTGTVKVATSSIKQGIAKSKTTVKFGPDKSYADTGYVGNIKKEGITIIREEGSYYLVEYDTTGDPNIGTKRGYVPKTQITISMNYTSKLEDFVANYEGFSANPYYCSSGKKTIGYGHVILPGEKFGTITKEEGKALLKKDLEWTVRRMNEIFLGKGINLKQQEFDAVVSFSFNAGGYYLTSSKGEKLYSMIKSSNTNSETLKTEFMKHIYSNGKPSNGLKNRRYDEWEIFVKGEYKRQNRY